LWGKKQDTGDFLSALMHNGRGEEEMRRGSQEREHVKEEEEKGG
jgi:hypothetical protein